MLCHSRSRLPVSSHVNRPGSPRPCSGQSSRADDTPCRLLSVATARYSHYLSDQLPTLYYYTSVARSPAQCRCMTSFPGYHQLLQCICVAYDQVHHTVLATPVPASATITPLPRLLVCTPDCSNPSLQLQTFRQAVRRLNVRLKPIFLRLSDTSSCLILAAKHRNNMSRTLHHHRPHIAETANTHLRNWATVIVLRPINPEPGPSPGINLNYRSSFRPQ